MSIFTTDHITEYLSRYWILFYWFLSALSTAYNIYMQTDSFTISHSQPKSTNT